MAKPKHPGRIVLSVVTPAFNEAQNLPLLYARLKKSLGKSGLSWEWIVVDDHSADETPLVLAALSRRDKRVRTIRFAKNSGSHLALSRGLKEAKGDCAVGIAADLQDPPELISQLSARWSKGAGVVWAVRAKREGERLSTVLFSRLYYFIVRNILGFKKVPPTGADFFLLDRAVLERLSAIDVRHASLLLLISSLGFKQDFVTYDKQERVHGKSGWSLRKKLKLLFDSFAMVLHEKIEPSLNYLPRVDFDDYKDRYESEIQKSISFIGQTHEFFTRVKVERLLSLVGKYRGDPGDLSVLDVGCGVGITDRYLKKHFKKVHGVDIGKGIIHRARRLNPEATYRVYDGGRLPYPDGSMDVTFATCVLHHVPTDQRMSFLEEMGRVTKKGGLVLVFEHNPLNPLTRHAVDRCELDEDAILIGLPGVKDLLQRGGLVPLKGRYILFTPFKGFLFRVLDSSLGWLPLGAQYFMVGRKPGPYGAGLKG